MKLKKLFKKAALFTVMSLMLTGCSSNNGTSTEPQKNDDILVTLVLDKGGVNDESFTGTVIHNLNGLIFRNRREYKKHIAKIYEDKTLYQKLSSQARISAETHSSKYFAEQILDVYRIAMRDYQKIN